MLSRALVFFVLVAALAALASPVRAIPTPPLCMIGFCGGAQAIVIPTPAPSPTGTGTPLPLGAFAFYATATSAPNPRPIVENNVTPDSYVAIKLWSADSIISGIVPQAQTVQLIDCVSVGTSKCPLPVVGCTTLSPLPGICSYDDEHWPQTPSSEQCGVGDCIGALNSFIAAVNGAATGQLVQWGPDGTSIGLNPSNCSFNLSGTPMLSPSFPWSGVTYWEIQDQALAKDATCGSGIVSSWINYVRAVQPIAAAGNPSIKLVLDLSFRDSTASTMIAAIAGVRGIPNVAVIKIAWPPTNCPNCSTDALQSVLSFIKNGS